MKKIFTYRNSYDKIKLIKYFDAKVLITISCWHFFILLINKEI